MNEWQQTAFVELCSAEWEGRSKLGFVFLSEKCWPLLLSVSGFS